MDRKKKIPVTILLRAFGYSTDEDILNALFSLETVRVTTRTTKKSLIGKVLAEDLLDDETGDILIPRGAVIDDDIYSKLAEELDQVILKLVSEENEDDMEYIRATLEKDSTGSHEEALLEVYQILRPGEPPTLKNAGNLIDIYL